MKPSDAVSAAGVERRRAAVRAVLTGRPLTPTRGEAVAYAPANIALCKYWGKRDAALHLPMNGSVSLSLGPHGTVTRVRPAACDRIVLNGERLSPGRDEARRLTEYLDLFRSPAAPGFEVQTKNTIPTAAGLASSASGFAALAIALDALFGWNLDLRAISILARLGSGSAARSVSDGFVEWRRGRRADGSDSFARRWPEAWPELRIGLRVLHREPKPVGSREGMRRTVETSPLYAAWPALARRDLAALRAAVRDRDFDALGRTAEANAMAMHATMLAARPAVRYWRPQTLAELDRVSALRAEGVAVFATMDAGPNVKLLFLADAEPVVRRTFPEVVTVAPFAPYKKPGLDTF